MLKQGKVGKELWGRTPALTCAAKAEGKRDRKETGGKTGRWPTSCGRVKAGHGGEGAAGADAEGKRTVVAEV